MLILGIETSCDETAAAIVEKTGNRIQILSNVIASSASLQARYGGIIPEQAAREQIKSIIPVIETAINDSRLTINDIDAIAVTYGPGLIGSLLVGVETAKTLSFVWNKPIIPVNHLLGHFWANWILNQNNELRIMNYESSKKTIIHDSRFITQVPLFPCIGLLVSGGHTDLVLFKNEQDYKYLGGTRDDAAGECFDKCARLLGLPYPGGPAIAQSAMKFKVQSSKFKIELPRPMINSKNFEFSFSGLKTAVANIVQSSEFRVQNEKQKRDLCASIEQAIVDVLVKKTVQAAKKYKVEHIMIAGGVAANQKLVENLKLEIRNLKLEISLHVPPASLCTDNAAMIASRGFFEKAIDPLKLQANPNLNL